MERRSRLTYIYETDPTDPDAWVDLYWNDVTYALIRVEVHCVRRYRFHARFNHPARRQPYTVALPGQMMLHPAEHVTFPSQPIVDPKTGKRKGNGAPIFEPFLIETMAVPL